jgi:penicillin-binding protein 1C
MGEPLVATRRAPPFLAPHFTSRVLALIDDQGECGGSDDADATSRAVDLPAGICAARGAVRTTLDATLQSQVESEVRATVIALKDREAQHAAAIVIDNATGAVRAWVGSPDFWADTAGQTDMVVSPRQPGSALKPFLYGLAFDRGDTPASVLADIARSYATPTGPYRPRNYDRRYHGPVRAREALGSSYNMPAVALADRVGVPALLRTLHEAGFSSLDRSADHYGLGLALGNGDVTLLEMANAFRGLANGGAWRPLRVLELDPRPASRDGRAFIDARSAALVLDILADPEARVPGFGIQTPFDFPFRAAVKTGTSRHFTDNWAVGVTAGFTVAVWVGNFNGHPMRNVSGVAGAGPLLSHVMLLAAQRIPPGDLVHPESVGAQGIEICRVSGKLAGPSCPRVTEWFAPGSIPHEKCDWHHDGVLTLPALYAEWAAQAAASSATPLAGGERRTLATVTARTREEARDGFRIVSPRDGDRYEIPAGVPSRYATVALLASGAAPGRSVAWSIDGHPARGSRLSLQPGAHVIRAEAGHGASDEVRITVE